MQRRSFLKTALVVLAPLTSFPKNVGQVLSNTKSNFKQIYTSNTLKAEFYKFLRNVFNIYPEADFHKLIAETTKVKQTDKDIYLATQAKLGEIDPFLSSFRYQLPALFKQKEEMAKQTLELLGEGAKFNGYLEIGSSGRYLDYLEERITIEGKRYYADGREPGYSIPEMVDRGQLAIGATYIPMTNYQTKYGDIIPKASIDLVTIYIGFHHCPIGQRTAFISSIRETMRKGGKLILRDHDCTTDEQKTLVALAHDVFNLGTKETWEYNHKEVRNFYSLDYICKYIQQLGFTFDKRTLYQKGDPTKNALMMFTKI